MQMRKGGATEGLFAFFLLHTATIHVYLKATRVCGRSMANAGPSGFSAGSMLFRSDCLE
ncbi:hypothetical protein DF3PA_40028 [Candidatus Defluviicoccus seviourii]|uniref:Uncharacterized protein n=2 Tax=root TaxID=1 RepID=A0A564WFA0_9PROT|nr:hypothetical protein DF3PB_2130004 [uncultured Defluviicoccus sp.]VUX47152.1 hypothetical protein DF3PA_40028 [Candidatus Defluviicoccus seviourii]